MDDLKNRWNEARQGITQKQSTEQLIKTANKKGRSVLYFHYGNIVVLLVTLVGISLFFYYNTPFQTLLSKTGVALMIGALSLRIIIEIFSSVKSFGIRLTKDAATTASNAISFYNFRKKIHGPVTLTTVGLYVLGFYALSPEFSIYIDLKWMILMHISFVAGALIIIWQVRKGIKKEMLDLSVILDLQQQISKEEDVV